MKLDKSHMSDDFFASETGRKQCLSAHEQAEALEDFEQTYQQFSAGKFEGFSAKVQLDEGCSMLLETYNQRLDQWGAVNKRTYCILFLMNGNGRSLLGSQDLDVNDVILMPPGAGYDLISHSFSYYCAFNFTKEYFDPYLAAIDPKALVFDHLPTPSVLRKVPEIMITLRDIAHRIMRTSNTTGDTPVQSCQFEGEIRLVTTIAATLMSGWLRDYHRQKPLQLDNRALAVTARDVLRKTSHLNYSMELFARSFGVSRRTLEISFRDQFDQSPSHYKRIIQLNNFRRALAQSGNRERTIGDIAADHGYWHLSRLSQMYERQFGELPSQSRQP